ncbi:HAD-IA family hydrolase [Pelagibacterium sp. 26DY04]|uniref:HAD-IA family hydrolase n=1 Tax=Pelagibacterium sp. 26DY04 TaxID=2967130 RepID=UPI0028169567|nr:HAD-IA family hydrolase [Pelagibacterium sp. 26DY04]WMT86652.1 HAD-IA family hydrolase [Pelagibacterium sp. 26DY04]
MLDVDGVVVKGRPADGMPWATDLERDLGVVPQRLQSEFFAPYWGEIIVGRRGLHEALTACLPKLSPTLSVDAFIDYWFSMDARIDEDVLAQCEELRSKGIAVSLATNQEHLRAKYLMEDLGLGEHVDGIFYSSQVGARKPDHAFFEAAALGCGMAPEALILVDDTEANVAAAIEAGWKAVHWTEGLRLTDCLSEFST